MSLKLYPRPSGIFHIRGTVQGQPVDQSSRTRIRAEAEAIRANLEADLFQRQVYGDKAVATFAEAAIGYMKAGGCREHLKPLIARLGNRRLSEINQMTLDDIASERDVKASTLIRQVYTPALAVLNFGARQNLCGPPSIRKPKIMVGRTDFLTPAQVDAWTCALPPYLSQLITFLAGTGCRITEALTLDWSNISPECERAVFWQTKSNYSRGADLCQRVRDSLPARGEGVVFRNSRGQPWHSYDAINLMLRKTSQKSPSLVPVHCHLFRHTWATWAYACTRDLTFVMGQGGWRSLALLGRYTHAGSSDLARDVLAKGWEFSGREIFLGPEKSQKDK
jgi:integrase